MHLYDIHTHNLHKDISDSFEETKVFNLTCVNQFNDLSFEYTDLYFSAGIHPWHLHSSTFTLSQLEQLSNNHRIVAIGEAGLDKCIDTDIKYQWQIFEQQIIIANQLDKPMIIHCVKAWDELIALYKLYKPNKPWIIHGYRGKVEQTKQLIHLGFKLSVGEQFNAESLQAIPLDSLFLETDTSTISIYNVYKNVAATLNIPIEKLAEAIEANMKKIIY